MNLQSQDFKNRNGLTPPKCVLEEELYNHLPHAKDFANVVLALTFESGPCANRNARSYVFYFYKGDIDPHQRPDEILTFKVRYKDTGKIHICDKYLGGMDFGAALAPPLAMCDSWSPPTSGLRLERQIKDFGAAVKQREQRSESGCGCFLLLAMTGACFLWILICHLGQR